MAYERTSRGLEALGLIPFLACGGTDTLDIDEETRESIRRTYVEGAEADEPAPVRGNVTDTSSDVDSSEVSAEDAAALERGPDGAGEDGATEDGAAEDGADAAESGVVASSCDGFAVLSTSCANGCHVTGNAYGVTAFADDVSRIDGLLGEPSATAGAGCGPLLDPESPTGSLIYQKSAGTQGASCGVAMPAGTPGLAQEQLDCLEGWIASL